jgi:hypothetical protein
MRTAAARAALAAVMALAGARGARADETVVKQAPAQPRTYPLVLLAQVDAIMANSPEVADVPVTGAALGNDPPPDSYLRLRRLRVGDDVRWGAWHLRGVLEAQAPSQPFTPVEGNRLPGGGPVRLPEAYAAWAPHRAFQLTAGAMRVPFSLSRQVDEADLRFPERAQVIVALAPDYRVGAAMTSDLGLLNLRVAGMSADTTLDRHLFTSGYLVAGRLSADPIGPMGVAPWRMSPADPWYRWWRFSAGVSALYGTLLVPDTLALGGDAQLQWLRFTMTAEYVAEHLFTQGGSWPRMGAVVEPGAFVFGQYLQLVLRAAWYRRPLDLTADPDDRTDTLATGAGLTVLLHSAQVRLQAAYETRRTRDALLADSSWAIFRATLTL